MYKYVHVFVNVITDNCSHAFCNQGIWKSGISIFASQLHTHLTGKQVFTKHYRAGAELPELNRDNHYSPHYQEIRKLQRPVKIMPVKTM